MYILIFGFVLLIVLWIIEFHNHQFWRKKIPLIIHVNGTRGKSSVVRLIAAGLRGGNKKVMAKTTGSAPAIIFEDGSETPIVRHYEANIKEQLKIIKFVAKRDIDILVLECMAVTPEYQWVTEQEMVHSDIGVVTNSRLDHLDVMGPGLRNCTLSLCNSLPSNGIAYTAEWRMFPLISKQAHKMGTKLIYSDSNKISDEMMRGFRHIEHKDNVAVSLDVCEHCQVERDVALQEMYKAKPDIGAAEIFEVKRNGMKIFFVHSFAANDPESTQFLINYVKKIHSHIDNISLVLNTREDRIYRSKQLIDMLCEFEHDELFLIGQQTQSMHSYAISHGISKAEVHDCGWVSGEELIAEVSKLPAQEVLLFGVGNIGGNGGIIVEYFRERNGKNV
ncbi:MAG: poly-gamma-glutamate synthase PgsB [Candidatus Cloacimonadales bacterium]